MIVTKIKHKDTARLAILQSLQVSRILKTHVTPAKTAGYLCHEPYARQYVEGLLIIYF
jgi:hypothetical protein